MTVKEIVEQVGRQLEPEATLREAMDQVIMRYKIEVGLQQIERGEYVTEEELLEQLSPWLK